MTFGKHAPKERLGLSARTRELGFDDLSALGAF